MDTFSANSLKLLDKDPSAFRLKYNEGLFLNPDNSSAKAGQNLHSFLCFYLKGFDMTKIEASFSNKDREFLDKIMEFDTVKTLKLAQDKNIEQPFLIKCSGGAAFGAESVKDNTQKEKKCTEKFYLTGRFDALLRRNSTLGKIQIFDWKMVNIPREPEFDIQTIVYLYAASKLYKTENVSVTYVSLSKDESVTVNFNPEFDYLSRISGIIKKAEM